jgi:hypothetical protein
MTPDAPARTSPAQPGEPVDTQTLDGIRFQLTTEELRQGTPAMLWFRLTDERGQPIDDLERYLGAPGHLFFTSEDFRDPSHVHPLEDALRPDVRFLVRAAQSGRYRMWLQVQRGGKVITTAWVVNVPELPTERRPGSLLR